MSNKTSNPGWLSLIVRDGKPRLRPFPQQHLGRYAGANLTTDRRFERTLTMNKVLGMLLTIAVLPACGSLIFARGGDGFAQAAASPGTRRTTPPRRCARQRRRVRRKAVRVEGSSDQNTHGKDSPTPGAQPIGRLPMEEDDYAVGSPRPPKKPVRRAPAKPEPIPDIRNP
jgi:hypothetical protein